MQNARCTEDTNKNKYVNKKRSTGKVDMVMATLGALYLAEQEGRQSVLISFGLFGRFRKWSTQDIGYLTILGSTLGILFSDT